MANENEVIEDYESEFSGEEIDDAIKEVRNPDSEPIEDSDKLITSGAVYSALEEFVPVPVPGSVIMHVASITTSSIWSGNDPYSQVVTISGLEITDNMKVDLQPTASQISSLLDDDVQALTIENNNGTLTLYSFGGTPQSTMTIQCIVTEITPEVTT